MGFSLKAARWLPSVVLLLCASAIAAAVNHFVASSEAGRVAGPTSGFGNPTIRVSAASYPRQAIDSDSFVVRVAKPARRIVSQYWSIDEYVYSVVPPERIVAVSEAAYEESFSNVYPLARRYHPAIASDPERVLRLDPDLLVVADSSRADFCAIVRAAHLPIYRTFTAFTTLAQVAETIRLTGYLTGEDEAAAAQTTEFWNEIARAKAKRPAATSPPRILGLSGMYSYGDETLFNDIVRELGGINVGARGGLKGYAQVNTEQVVRWNPEWIVASAGKGRTQQVLARLMADPGIAVTQAAKNGHIVVLEEHIFMPMSPYVRLLVSAIAEALYG